MNETIKNTIILTVITVIAGLFLGYVYDITKEPIRLQEEKTKQEAYQKVFPEAASFTKDNYDMNLEWGANLLYLAEAGYPDEEINEVMMALDASGKECLGFVFMTTTHEGYGGDITISMGIKADGTVTGMEILSIGETAGLGMKAKEDAFKNQFANKAVTNFTYTKTGSTADYEIDALSGATITTNAVVNAVDATLVFYQDSNLSSGMYYGTSAGGAEQ
ncbi:MAG: RnfABCDGE type electron transport complex subunit G [bacterium]|nr:RnfABCDGE type electron transport complex subunit G [bacterium]